VISGNAMVIAPGLTCTVEPGNSVPNLGGVRVEENVAVTRERGRRPDGLSPGASLALTGNDASPRDLWRMVHRGDEERGKRRDLGRFSRRITDMVAPTSDTSVA
jgi:hypothetical protein